MNISIITLLISIILVNITSARNYYLSNREGDDSRTSIQAQNPLTPWKTLKTLNLNFSVIQPGDSILFARGEIFSGTINITQSGSSGFPIILSAYGKGSNPIIVGMTTLVDWANNGKGIWESQCTSCGDSVNILIINGKIQPIGRFPNTNAINKGYLKIESHLGKNQIKDSKLTSTPDWTGGDLVIRTKPWLIDKYKITQHKVDQITYIPSARNEPTDNYGYFIKNHRATLDERGEWFYNTATKKMEMFWGSNTPSANIESAVVKNLIIIHNQSNITFENILFKGANENIFDISSVQNVKITHCEILYSGENAINGFKTRNLIISDNIISDINNNAINLFENCSSTTIKNNTIKNIGIYPGMGKNGDYNAIEIVGRDNIIEYNNIDSVGYIPIRFSGDSVTISNNFINFFTLIKDDGGGIYTWTGSGNISAKGRKIEQNIILNGIGATEGTNLKVGNSHGIYMDDNTGNVEILNNTVANCSYSGIFLHNSNNINCKNNTLYNNGCQLLMAHKLSTCKDCTMQNNNFTNNILFSKTSTQHALDLISFTNDIENFGVFNSNYYCRPLADDRFIYIDNGKTGENLYDLKAWQNSYHIDEVSQKSPFQIPAYTINNLVGTNKFNNGNFNTNINGLYCYSPTENCKTLWDNTGKLDGGSLQIIFPTVSSTPNPTSLLIGIGTVKSGKNYILKFSTIGSKENISISVYLRQSQAPYKKLTSLNYCLINDNRSENELLLSPLFTENDASLGIDIDDQDSTLWLDNIEIFEADVSITNPDSIIRFEYNPTMSIKKIELSDTYYDVRNNKYSGIISLNPFSSLILMKKP